MPYYVITSDGEYLVQRQADNMWGFELCSEDQSWPGGHGLPSSSWETVDEGDVPPEVKDRLDYLCDEDVEDDWPRFHSDDEDIDIEDDLDIFDEDSDDDDENFFDDNWSDVFDGEE